MYLDFLSFQVDCGPFVRLFDFDCGSFVWPFEFIRILLDIDFIILTWLLLSFAVLFRTWFDCGPFVFLFDFDCGLFVWPFELIRILLDIEFIISTWLWFSFAVLFGIDCGPFVWIIDFDCGPFVWQFRLIRILLDLEFMVWSGLLFWLGFIVFVGCSLYLPPLGSLFSYGAGFSHSLTLHCRALIMSIEGTVLIFLRSDSFWSGFGHKILTGTSAGLKLIQAFWTLSFFF